MLYPQPLLLFHWGNSKSTNDSSRLVRSIYFFVALIICTTVIFFFERKEATDYGDLVRRSASIFESSESPKSRYPSFSMGFSDPVLKRYPSCSARSKNPLHPKPKMMEVP